MPHLSPMTWLMAPLLFFFILSALFSSNWWSYSPQFPTPMTNKPSSSPSTFSSWNWA